MIAARSRRAAIVALVIVLSFLAGPDRSAAQPAGRAPAIFTSFEAPPTPDEVAVQVATGVRTFEIDLDKPGADAAVAAIKKGGGTVVAYHVGGGGGRAWGSVKADEWVRRYDSPRDFLALTEDVKRLVAQGASAIHFDNTHRFSGRRLEAIADAIVAGGAGFVAKNNPEKWNLVLKRRADLRPAYAIVEDAMFDAEATQAAYGLFARGIGVTMVGFRKPVDPKGTPVTDDYARAYAAANPWARVLLFADERAWDSRSAVWFP